MSIDKFGRSSTRTPRINNGFRLTVNRNLDVNNRRIINAANPENDQDVTTLAYVNTCLENNINTLKRKLTNIEERIDNKITLTKKTTEEKISTNITEIKKYIDEKVIRQITHATDQLQNKVEKRIFNEFEINFPKKLKKEIEEDFNRIKREIVEKVNDLTQKNLEKTFQEQNNFNKLTTSKIREIYTIFKKNEHILNFKNE